MANTILLGDQVFVPRVRVGLDNDTASSFHFTTVVEKDRGKIRVDLPGAETSPWISVSYARKQIRALVLAIGDFKSEPTLIDPLFKTTLHHLRLLLAEEEARGLKVRSLKELETYWQEEQSELSHVVLIGHGKSNALFFGVDGWIGAKEIAKVLRSYGAPKKHFLSLCCRTGHSDFSRKFSNAAICEDIVAPLKPVHGAIASQFCHTYFLAMYLGGKSSKVAYNKAKDSIVINPSFRFWDNGKWKK